MTGKKTFSNKEVAKLLGNVAAAYEVLNENQFKIAAYQEAAVSIEHSTSEVKDLWDDGKLDEIPGVGKGIASHLDELFKKGKVRQFESIFKKLPPSMFIFLEIPGIGPKTAFVLANKLKIIEKEGAIKKLKKAAEKGMIRTLENFGEKSEEEILKGVNSFEKGELKITRMLLPNADELANEIIAFIKLSPEVIDAHPLGSLRRKVATIGDIDISVNTKNPQEVIDHFVKFKKIREVLNKGKSHLIRVILFNGQQVDVRFSKPKDYGSMLQYFTGSKLHNIKLREFALKKGLSLSEYGIKKVKSSKPCLPAGRLKVQSYGNEKDFYHELGLDWIPPELREGTEEIEFAQINKLPSLVKLTDIKGDLHVHSNFNIEPSHDLGESTPSEMITEAINLGYEYLGFSEHNPSNANHTKKSIIDLLKKKKETFDKLNYSSENRANKLPIKILNGIEVDIKPDGSLSLPEEGFRFLDYVIASVHNVFDLDRETMTKRILTALSHPKVKILGHPTGRLLEKREGYELDWDKIFDCCLKNNKILEISAWPDRLDLPDIMVREAVKRGVILAINSDSHSKNQMKFMEYGVYVARRGWAEKKDIINCLPFKVLNDILLK